MIGRVALEVSLWCVLLNCTSVDAAARNILNLSTMGNEEVHEMCPRS